MSPLIYPNPQTLSGPIDGVNRIRYGFQTNPPPTNATVHRNDRGQGHLRDHRRGHRNENTLQEGKRTFLVIEGLL